MSEASFQNSFNIKYVPWHSLFPLVPSLGSLDEHVSSCGRAKMAAWPCINLKMRTCINLVFHILLQWPSMFHLHQIHHYVISLKGPTKRHFMHDLVPMHSAKRMRCLSMQHADSTLSHVPSFLVFLHPIPFVPTHQTFHWINMKHNIAPHSHFHSNFQTCPSTYF